MKCIHVLLADDHMIVRQGLRSLLESEGDIKIIHEAETGRGAVKMTKQLLPDVIIMDIAMPLLNGLEATRQILQILPKSRIIILSAYEDDAYLERALETGVAGFLIKQTSANILAEAVRAVAKGKTFFTPSVAKRLSQYEKNANKVTSRKRKDAQLTSREMEVLQLIAEGLANKQTAGELGISIKTVEKHRQQLMAKLNAHNTASLTRHAIEMGVIESSSQRTKS
ncbi:MAG: response regulator transcription factor [Chthoniobacterales bacterium]